MKKIGLLSIVFVSIFALSCNRTPKPVMSGEDFYYSAKQAKALRQVMVTNIMPGARGYINGIEFTQRGKHPLSCIWDDAVLVAENVPEGTEDMYPGIIFYKTISQEEAVNAVLDDCLDDIFKLQ